MEIKKFRLFESVELWNDFIDKINRGVIPKDKIDFPNTEKLTELIPIGSRILDISIGDGVYSEYFIEKGYDVYGTDISDLAIKTMREKHPENTWVVHDTLNRFPFSNNFFDLVFARLALHYFSIDEVEKILPDIERILKPEGYLYILVKNSNTGNIITGKFSYTTEMWLDPVSKTFKVVDYKEEFKRAYSFEKEPSNLLHIICRKN
jgi:ubiquinone/menaquinone biosynthesis C-methylase UbiE